jgi:hypothetical protein
MTDVVVQRLGKAVPGEHGNPPENSDKIDARPLVLWRGSTPAAVFYYRGHSRALWAEQRIERLDDESHWFGRGHGPFPLVFSSEISPGGEADGANSFDDSKIVIADVNGDGVDELLLPRQSGAIGVYGLDTLLFEQLAPSAPQGTYYHTDRTFTAKLPGRDVAFFLLTLKKVERVATADAAAVAKAERHILFRVDDKGIARVPLPPGVANVQDIIAFGALNRPGSRDVDEVLLLIEDDRNKTFLSRLRPEGGAIEPPKEVYVQLPSTSAKFLFLSGTPQAILVSESHVFFIRPEKASNWMADVDLSPLASSHYDLEILQATDPGTDPKVTVAVTIRQMEGRQGGPIGADLYAVNSEGKCFRRGPSGEGWQALSVRSPYLQTRRPTDQHIFLGIHVQPGSDVLLAGYSREAQLKEISDEEVMKAAERFLRPEVIASERSINRVEFGIEELKEIPNHSREERQKRGVTEPITSVEQWKRLLPDTYAQVLAEKTRDFIVSLRCDLERGAERPIDPEKYQDIEEYKVWLGGLHIGPETLFQVIRRSEVAAGFQIAAFLPREVYFDFRASSAGVSIVSPLDLTPSVGASKQPLGFYLVHLNRKIF